MKVESTRFVMLAWLMVTAAAAAQAPARKFDLPAQPATTSIAAFARQANVQLLISAADAQALKTNAVHGSYSVQEALNLLLTGTGLMAEVTGPQTYTITRKNRGSKDADARAADGGPAGQMRLAALTEEEKARAEASQSSDPAEVDRDSMTVRDSREKPAPFAGASIDLARSRDDVLPFQTFDARDIELSGATNLAEFFRNRLTQNFTSTIAEQINGNLQGSINSNRLDFNGWGDSSEVVILLNGRRLPAQRQQSGETSTPGDYRGIALAAIERIEVLPAAGSAIYGESATSGVINIITRQDYKGGSTRLSYESPASGGSSSRAVEISYGRPLRAGLRFNTEFQYNDYEPLTGADRGDVTTLRWRQVMLERNPARIFDDSRPPVGGTPNIRARFTTSTGLFGNGTPVFTSVPDGYAGGQGLAPFLARQGVYNLELSRGGTDGGLPHHSAVAEQTSFGTPMANTRVKLGFEQALGTQWRMTLEYQSAKTGYKGQGRSIVNSSGYIVPGTAAVNPFGQDIRVFFVDPRMDAPQKPELTSRLATRTDTTTLTLRGGHGEWRGLLDLAYTHDRSDRKFRYFGSPLIDGAVLATTAAAWTEAFVRGLYNPLVDMRVTEPAAQSFYDEYLLAGSGFHSASRHYTSSAKVSGPLWRLPGGPLQLTAGAEWFREDRYRARELRYEVHNRTGQALRPGTDQTPLSSIFLIDNYSGYAEAVLPVLGGARQFPLVDRLELFVSGRVSRNVRNGHRFSDGLPVKYTNSPYLYAAGLRYDVVQGVALRASWSTGFKPPQFGHVSPGLPPTTGVTVFDPRRNSESTPLTATQFVTGGNPDLEPEGTRSANFGVILQPARVRGLWLSLDYLENVRDDAITSISQQNVLDLEFDPAMAGRVQRAAPEAGAPNGVGRVIFVDARSINLRQLSSKSANLTVEQRVEGVRGGRLVFSGAATKRMSFKSQTTLTTAPVEQVGNPTAAFFRQLKWNANAQVRWEGSQWALGWSARFFDDVLANPAWYVEQGATRAPAQVEHDLFASYRFATQGSASWYGALLDQTSLSMGIKNVFDRDPRFLAQDYYGYTGYDSLMGRTAWLQMGRNF